MTADGAQLTLSESRLNDGFAPIAVLLGFLMAHVQTAKGFYQKR
jgi:hypothetical protein